MATLDLSLLDSAVRQNLDLSATATEDTAQAQAQTVAATGATQEAGLYGNAIQIANSNAALEQMAGNVTSIQEGLKLTSTLGSQRAAVAGNGFGAGGVTALMLGQSSVRQGHLAQQLNTLQTNINAGGFQEQAAASTSEQAAANTAAASATTLATAETNAAAVATANSANETAAIEALQKQEAPIGQPLTPEQQAQQDTITAVLKSPLNGAAALPASANPATALQSGGLGTMATVLGGFQTGASFGTSSGASSSTSLGGGLA